jgi:outer membrane protein TolC
MAAAPLAAALALALAPAPAAPAPTAPAPTAPAPTAPTAPAPAAPTAPASPFAPAAPDPAAADAGSPLEPVTFDEAVARALARSPASLFAAEEVRRAEGLRTEAASGALPQLGATATQTRLDADRVTGSGSSARVVAARDQTSLSAALAVPLVAPSRWAQWAHAEQQVDAARAGEGDARRAAALAAGRAYLAVLAGRSVLRVAESARDGARAHHDFARTRRAAGLGNALDELQAEQELEASEVQVQAAADALDRAREALGLATGGDAPLDALERPPLPEPAGPEPAGVERRADVRAARSRAGAADRVARDAWADWLPALLGTAQAFFQDPATLTTPRTGWQAQLVLSVPIVEGGLRLGQAREREALRQEAALEVDALLRQARSEVRAAWAALGRARLAAAAARRGAVAADAALALADAAWKEGAVNSLQVVDAQRRARDAGIAAAVAEQGERQALLDLLAATGSFP